MDTPAKMHLSSLSDSLSGQIDVFICSASFEARCLSLPDQIASERIGAAIVCANENFPDVVIGNGKKLLTQYGSKGISVLLSTDDPLKTADGLQKAIEAVNKDRNSQTHYFVHITTFTHEALLILQSFCTSASP